ncbi:MAG: transglutaminase-like domain-containing protein [bacterium]|jgi:regulator of sirC expression with transglutaminase-like and TPR domain|nr:transglutaminase-like domain-containing protein [bacterium]
MLEGRRLKIIIDLLSDEDADIAASMRHKLYEMGEEVVQSLLDATDPDSRVHKEASRVLMRFREPSLEDRFRNLATDEFGDIDLEEGVFTLARFAYPHLDVGGYKTRLGHMAFELAPQVAPDDHPIRVIRTLNHYLFESQKFRAPLTYDADDTYINRVLDRKRGWPITLSVVYLLLGQRIDLPLVGIAMPKHYLVKYRAPGGQEIYIDAYHHGQVLTPNECAELIGTKLTDDLLPEATNRFTLFRMMNNLKHTYLNEGDGTSADRLSHLINILQEVH